MGEINNRVTIQTSRNILDSILGTGKRFFGFQKEDPDTIPKIIPLGFKFCGNPIMEDGTFEEEEVHLFQKILPHTDVVINIGANIGYYCCIALLNGKHTVAFEPIESNLSYLYKNIHANQWEENIEIFPMALGDHSGLVEMYGKGTGASLIKGWAKIPENDKRFVPISTLDKAIGSRFSKKRCFFMVDIEGAERNMLKGAGIFLNMEPKPFWMVEISITEHWPEGMTINPYILETFEEFWNSGYEAWTADRRVEKVTEDEIRKIVSSGKDTILTHNFLFIEKGKKMEIIGA